MPNITVFEAEGETPSERLGAWTDHIFEGIFDARISSLSVEGLRARKTARDMGDMVIHFIESNEHIVERSLEKTRANPLDFIFFTAVIDGRCVFHSAHMSEIIHPGEVLAYDPGEPYVLGVQADTTQLFIRIPREYFRRELGFDFPTNARKARVGIAGLDELNLASLTKYAHSIGDPEIADEVIREQSRLMIDVTVQLSYTGESNEVLVRAREAIDRLHDNPDTRSIEIAKSVNVSLRQLDRLFAERGTSTAKQITVARVNRARGLMVESSLSISDIAYRCGFGSVDTMNRQFKTLFGSTAATVRDAKLS